MKSLNGRELAEFIKERQAGQVRALRQAWQVQPRLAVVQTTDDPVISSYVSMKRRYADDILVELEHHQVSQDQALATIEQLNTDPKVHGIIVQLPLADPSKTAQLLAAVAPAKDIDGLTGQADYTPATAQAINWLLAGYNISLQHKKLLIIGHGRLVGQPLERLWLDSGLTPQVIDINTAEADFLQAIQSAEVIVTATGQPGLITGAMLAPGTVIVDAGVASEEGRLVGDLAADARSRDDLILTPEKGGVGPLTICALFDNLIIAARHATEQ